jgi:hypothetical protein
MDLWSAAERLLALTSDRTTYGASTLPGSDPA